MNDRPERCRMVGVFARLARMVGEYAQPTWICVMLLACVAAAPATQSLEQRSIRPDHIAAPTPADTTAKTPATDGLGVGRVAAALGVVLAAILVMRWAGKRVFASAPGGGGSSAVRIISRTTVGPRQQLLLIQVGRRLVLASNAGGQMNALCEVADETEVAELLAQVRGNGKAFDAALGQAGQSYAAGEPAPDAAQEPAADEPAVAQTRQEINGLMDKVRSLAKRFAS